MKLNKKIVACVIALIIIVNFSTTYFLPVYAHNTLLDIEYDVCVKNTEGDGIDEIWYCLESTLGHRHLSNETDTITYRFEGTPEEWTPNTNGSIIEDVDELIKSAFANSLEKWNNIYFYSYNFDGTITKNKLINIEEATQDTANITIRPNTSIGAVAKAIPRGGSHMEETGHMHHSTWIILVNIDAFCTGTSYATMDGITGAHIAWNNEYAGAHEMGHVLGLADLDSASCACYSNNAGYHHGEVLMGYENDVEKRTTGITYKDIAGVAITRGFHTNNDHKWLNMGQQSDGTYKLVCSICNGVKTVSASELNEYLYSTYGACEGDHDNLLYGNMMAVASYGNQDYYKCRYCRYVAPFSEIVDQNYEITPYSNDYHKCENIVAGLEYSFYEAHSYDTCVYLNKLSHQRICACGATQISSHYISGTHVGEDWVPCAGCGYLLDMREDIHEGIMSITQVSINGSYIRSDGIVVLVDEDIEAYLAGTLQFYHPANLPVTQ